MKDVDSGIAEVRKRLETDTQDRPGLLVSDRCEYLIQEFLGYKEDHVGTSQATDHCADSLRYAVMQAHYGCVRFGIHHARRLPAQVLL